MRLLWMHVRAGVLELLRIPWLLFPMLILPGMLFLFFIVPIVQDDRESATLSMASFVLFAVLSVAFNHFGVGIAQERTSPWETFLRTLPLPPLVRFTARILTALLFACAAGGVIIVMALLLTPARLEIGTWLQLGVAVLLGSIPFALLGIAIGYWASPRAAAPVANLLWLPLAFLGGLWGPPPLPSIAEEISPFTPTRRWGNLVWSVALDKGWQIEDWLWLLGYTIIFGLAALWGYRRDEGQRYR